MVKIIKYSVLIICVVSISVTRADIRHHTRNKRTIGYLFRTLANTFAPTTQKPLALPTAQPLKIIPPPAAGTTTSTQPSVYKKKNYSPSMPAPDSEVIKPPIKPLVFPVISSPMPPFTAYYYQIFPSAVGIADGGGNAKSENYVSVPEKPTRPTERAPIKAQLIVFPFPTAGTGNENVNNDKNYNNDDDDDDERTTITRLPLEKRKPIEKPPFNYRAEIFVHPRGTSGSITPQDSDDDYRSYESKENVSTDKKKWLEVGDLLNPSQKRNGKNNEDSNVQITKEKMVKICSVDENKPLTYNKQEKPSGANKDVEYVKPTRSRGKEDRTGGNDDDDDDDDDDRYEEKSTPDDEEEKHEDDEDEDAGRSQEVNRGKYRSTESNDGHFDFYRQNRPDSNFGRIVGDFYINFPHSISRGGYDFAVDHGRINHGQVTDAPFRMDSSFPVGRQKMDQFLPQTIYQNPFLAPRSAQQNTNKNYRYDGANNFDKTSNHNPTNNFFPQLGASLHDFPTPVPHADGRNDATTDRSFNTYDRYNTNQNNQGLSGKKNNKEHDTDDHISDDGSHETEDESDVEESSEEDRKYSYSNDDDTDSDDEETDKEVDEDHDEDHHHYLSGKVEDSVKDGESGKTEESATEQKHAEPPRLPSSLHEEGQRNEGRQLQYIQHPPVFDMSVDKTELAAVCYNMFGHRIICS